MAPAKHETAKMEEGSLQSYPANAACGGNLKETTSYPSAMFRGERVYFCTAACLRAFEQQPDLFMAGEIEHPKDDA